MDHRTTRGGAPGVSRLLLALCVLLSACTPNPPPVLVATGTPLPAPSAPVPSLPPPTQPPATATATTIPSPTPTATPSPTPTPVLRRLTEGGCCVQPYWSSDGRQVRFIDRPGPDAPVGVYGVDVTGSAPALVTERLGIYSADGKLVAYPENGVTMIERVGGERWVAPSGGRPVTFSPDGTQIVWQISGSSGPNESRVTEVWLSGVDGADARRVARLVGGGFAGWFPDGARLLVSGRDSAGADPHYDVLSLADGTLARISQAPRLRGASLSPEGGWLAYTVAFSGAAAYDGLWVVRTDGADARRLDLFGAYRWRAEGRLLVMPLEIDARAQRLIEVDVATGVARALTDPAVTPLRVEAGDWALSPDGRRIAFVSAEDHNIWLIDLPD